jgi:lipopolysaccharide/colanic/teichoic acid biosynthesis glycosyltransferase
MSEINMDAVAGTPGTFWGNGNGPQPRTTRSVHRAALADALRRSRDIAGSVLLLLLTLPLLLVVACLIKLDSRGPVLYRQDRVGLNGRVFTLLKFRSMRMDAEAAGPCWAAQRDPRVTQIGAFIRACRIDEFPQLVNVLRGEMSLVGPRPERPHFTAQLERVIPRYRDRTRVLPGITGLAQISYPYGASIEDARAKLRFDLEYLANRSLLLDLRILAATVRVMLFRIGAR